MFVSYITGLGTNNRLMLHDSDLKSLGTMNLGSGMEAEFLLAGTYTLDPYEVGFTFVLSLFHFHLPHILQRL